MCTATVVISSELQDIDCKTRSYRDNNKIINKSNDKFIIIEQNIHTSLRNMIFNIHYVRQRQNSGLKMKTLLF